MSNIQRYRLDNGILRDSHGDRVYMLPGDLILDSSLSDAHKEAEIAALEKAMEELCSSRASSATLIRQMIEEAKERP